MFYINARKRHTSRALDQSMSLTLIPDLSRLRLGEDEEERGLAPHAPAAVGGPETSQGWLTGDRDGLDLAGLTVELRAKMLGKLARHAEGGHRGAIAAVRQACEVAHRACFQPRQPGQPNTYLPEVWQAVFEAMYGLHPVSMRPPITPATTEDAVEIISEALDDLATNPKQGQCVYRTLRDDTAIGRIKRKHAYARVYAKMLRADMNDDTEGTARFWFLYRVLKHLIELDDNVLYDNVLYDPELAPHVELGFGGFVEAETHPRHKRRIATGFDPLPDSWQEVRDAITAASQSKDEGGWFHPQYGHIEAWDVSHVRSTKQAFATATGFDRDLSGWDVEQVGSMKRMFADHPLFTGRGLECWDVSNLMNAQGMFSGAVNFDGDLSGWDVSSVNVTSHMFAGAASFRGVGLSKWRPTNALWSANHMFHGAHAFNANLAGWDVGEVRVMKAMFRDARRFEGKGLSGWQPANATDMDEMFMDATSFNADLSSWDTPILTSYFRNMFRGASSFGMGLSRAGRRALLPRLLLQLQATDEQLGWPPSPPATRPP